jgi:hypothetical protein
MEEIAMLLIFFRKTAEKYGFVENLILVVGCYIRSTDKSADFFLFLWIGRRSFHPPDPRIRIGPL